MRWQNRGDALPDVYRAMVEAGLRSGRLADALQGLSRVGLAVVEARRTIVLACFYPLLVLVMAYALFLFFLIVLFPRFTECGRVIPDRRLPDYRRSSSKPGATVMIWGPIIPLALLGVMFAWTLTGRSRVLDGTAGMSGPLAAFPWVGRIVANYRAANFITLLAHLVDHDVPLDQAVRLAGDAAGSPRFRRSVADYADRLAAGSTAHNLWNGSLGDFPPLVAWMIGSGQRQGSLASGLRHLATAYKRKGDRQAEAFRIIFPGLLILVVGTGAVLSYGLLLFVPLRHLWDGLANPLN